MIREELSHRDSSNYFQEDCNSYINITIFRKGEKVGEQAKGKGWSTYPITTLPQP